MLISLLSYFICNINEETYMRIYGITIHNVPNFGSVLQTLATQILLSKRGVEYETINYYQPRDLLISRIKSVLLFSKQPIVKRLVVFLTMDVINRYVFSSFLRRRIKLTQKVTSLKEIEKLPKPDIYLTGSDQVWNSSHNKFVNTTYYYEGIRGKKVSFSSSFGRSEIPQNELDVIKPLLDEYDMLSVREDSGVSIINKILPGKNVVQIVDPTLLIGADEWREYKTHKISRNNRYVLIYPMNGIDYRLFDIASNVASNIGNCEVWILSPGIKTYKQCDRTLKFQSPESFLELIDKAVCVVTNSFHGTAFSINFKTPFVSLMPGKFSTRLQSLLELTSLTDRIWNEKYNYDETLNIDFTNAHNILKKERVKADEYITNIIIG